MLGRGLQSLIPPQDPNKRPLEENADRSFDAPTHPASHVPPVPAPVPVPRHESPQQKPQTEAAEHQAPPHPKAPDLPPKYHEPVFHIEIAKIVRNPHQPRKMHDENSLQELAASIREYGILQPLVVTRIVHETPEGARVEYQLIAGERRLLASKIAGLERVPAIVKEPPKDEREKLEMALIENIQRADLNPLDTARAYAKLQDEFGLSQREIAQRLGKSREAVANAVRLLQLPREAQTALSDGRIGESHARLLLSVPDPAVQRAILAQTLEHNLSVRETQELIERNKQGEPAHTLTPRPQEYHDPEADFMRRRLEEALGTRVKLVKRGQKGKITINFFSEEELKGIVEKFLNEK